MWGRAGEPSGPLIRHRQVRENYSALYTLARRLAAEGLSFAAVLEEMRRELALRYLEDARLSISQVAWLLGFQEAGAFTHAFRRWTGQTPSEMRRSELLPDRVAPRPRSASDPN